MMALWRTVTSRNMNSQGRYPGYRQHFGRQLRQLADVVQFGNVLEKPQHENQRHDLMNPATLTSTTARSSHARLASE
jgi:hypothetical protein